MSVNKVILLGHVGIEPEVKYVDRGVAVAQVRLATSEPAYTLENGTTVPERTEWHNVVLWRKQAELVERYVHKGDKLYIEGKIRSRSYDDKNGIRRYVTEIYADTIELLTPRPVGGQTAPTPSEVKQPTSTSQVVSAPPSAPTDAPF